MELHPLLKGKAYMELKKLLQFWNSFPEMSMEERPVLSSDLEKIVVKNPLSDAFYIRQKLLIRIVIFGGLLLFNTWQLRVQWTTGGPELRFLTLLLFLLIYALYFHIRLVFFADYPTLLALPLVTFLAKLETILDKYILSFRLLSALTGFYGMMLIELLLSRSAPGAYGSLSHNDWYKGLIVIFLAVSADILLLHTIIPRHRRLLATVR